MKASDLNKKTCQIKKTIFLISLLIFFATNVLYAQQDGGIPGQARAPKKTIDKKGIIWGVYIGLGTNLVPFPKASVGVDMVSPVSDKFAIGAFAGYQSVASVSMGMNMLIGDYGNKQAFFYGAGLNFNGSRAFVLNRLGIRSPKSRLYGFLELGFGEGGGGMIWSLNLGLNF
jgi:hypothetical protein